jgi:hypothetical protein
MRRQINSQHTVNSGGKVLNKEGSCWVLIRSTVVSFPFRKVSKAVSVIAVLFWISVMHLQDIIVAFYLCLLYCPSLECSVCVINRGLTLSEVFSARFWKRRYLDMNAVVRI